jgi:hypothetical protein
MPFPCYAFTPVCHYAFAPLSHFSPFTDKITHLTEFIRNLTDKTLETELVL